MMAETEQYVLVSATENRYWAGFFPDWGALATFIAIENPPSVIEPHYHDNDEFWLWIRGEGKARLDHGPEIPFERGMVVYCPMGAVHEFVSPTVQYNIGVTTHLVGQKRPLHLHVPEDGELYPRRGRERGAAGGGPASLPTQRVAVGGDHARANARPRPRRGQ
jgi:mannose-6-phosphate isomerase-like protein (cupin superfamily)